MTLTDSPSLDAVQQKAIRLNLAWYRTGRSDPTTWLGDGAMVRGVLTPMVRRRSGSTGGTPESPTVGRRLGPGRDWAAPRHRR